MRMLSEMCSEASVARWQQDNAELPTWEAAHHRILTEGKQSKVKHPSPLQASGVTAPATMQAGFKMPAPPI
jgi:hypothetical protein